MAAASSSIIPFTYQIPGLRSADLDADERRGFADLLPAAHRTREDHIVPPQQPLQTGDDFRIAREKGLLPSCVTWESWKAISQEILQSHCYASVNPRYWYGELRLSRLNKIYRVRKGFLLRGYSKVAAHTVYVDLLRDNFAALAAVLGYAVIVLTAMQVGLGTERLQADRGFQDASYGFTVFAIVAPLLAGLAICLAVLAMFVANWVATERYEGKRFRQMGVEPYWRSSRPGRKQNSRVPLASSKSSSLP
ncbi:hypothetical protein F4778DRAFT_786621 [Xylariomycetidae sp. FL2044]|nr:hypothetical protein F4778DRAFT_786621 [Xylariomycetidae sp. FL2044]